MAETNQLLIDELIRDGYLKSSWLIDAFKNIDRKNFVPREHRDEAYGNYPLPIGSGQTISQPLTVAFMFELLRPLPGEKILDVGSGSGWTTALLAQIVGAKGRIVSVERIPELCKFGEDNVRKYNFIAKGIVKFFCGDGSKGIPSELLPRAGFDKVLAGATAAGEVPVAWKEQLKIGGRIVAPVGQSIVVLDKIGESKFETREHFGFSFVPLISDGSI